MSKIGRKPIGIPEGVTLKLEGNVLIAKGSLGELSLDILPEVVVRINEADKQIEVELAKNSQATNFWGLTRSLVNNLVIGVSSGFTKELEIDGVGFKFEVQGSEVKLAVGFSHPVEYELPEGIKAELDKNVLRISGIDKALVGQVAADIRSIKKPEPYKGKGIHYVGEVIRRKEGKKAGGDAGGEA